MNGTFSGAAEAWWGWIASLPKLILRSAVRGFSALLAMATVKSRGKWKLTQA